MAKEFLIHEGPAKAKMRHPLAVWLLCLIPFYGLWWWYSINWELGDLGEARDVELGQNPLLSGAAWGLGPLLLFVPTIWTITTTTKRIQRAQRLVGAHEQMSGWVASFLWVLTLGIGGIIYTQWSMNRIWETQPEVKYLTPEQYANLPGDANRVGPTADAPGESLEEKEARAVLIHARKKRELKEAEDTLKGLRSSEGSD